MNKQNPDVGTIVKYYDAGYANTMLANRSFRIDFWMKATPVKEYQAKHEFDESIAEFFVRLWNDKHPDWHHEYELHYCTREEATHVAGSNGEIVAINDSKYTFTNEYVQWNDEMIEEHRQAALFYVQWEKDEPLQFTPYMYIMGEYHD